MISFALALLAPVTAGQVSIPRTDSPTASEKAELQNIAKKCGLHDGALYFIQYNIPQEPVIHFTRALGDTEAQNKCVLENMPQEWASKFGLDTETMPPTP